MVPLLLLAACASPSPGDSGGDTAADTGGGTGAGPVSAPVADSTLVIAGSASSATGFNLTFGPDTDGDGTAAAWVSGYFTHHVCRFEGQLGTLGLLDGATCFVSSRPEYPGYGLAVGEAYAGLGAIGADEQGIYTGAVYLMDTRLGAGTHDVDEAAVVLTGEAAEDNAGTALAWLRGADTETLAVGASGNDYGGAGAGRVYVWPDGLAAVSGSVADAPLLIHGTSPPAAVRHGAPEAGDGAGSVLVSSGDLDGDGLDELVLGCNGADDGGANAGLAAVFTAPFPTGIVALRDADVLLTGTTDDALVGDSAAALGDVDGDGHDDLAIAGEMTLRGRTWVFRGPLTTSTTDAAFASFTGVTEGDNAGASVGGAGDTDGDGFADLIVGALGNSTGGQSAGAAYLVFSPLSAGAHSLSEADATWLGATDGDALGRAVAGGGDYDGDGLADVLLGAPYSDLGGAFGGAAYVITGR